MYCATLLVWSRILFYFQHKEEGVCFQKSLKFNSKSNLIRKHISALKSVSALRQLHVSVFYLQYMPFLKHFKYFYFEIIKRYCKNSAQSSYVPDTQIPPVITNKLTLVLLTKSEFVQVSTTYMHSSVEQPLDIRMWGPTSCSSFFSSITPFSHFILI